MKEQDSNVRLYQINNTNSHKLTHRRRPHRRRRISLLESNNKMDKLIKTGAKSFRLTSQSSRVLLVISHILIISSVSSLAPSLSPTTNLAAGLDGFANYSHINESIVTTSTATTSTMYVARPTTSTQHQQQQQQQQQQLNEHMPMSTSALASNTVNAQQQQQLVGGKKGAQAWQNHNLGKFLKYLSEHQQELVRKNPGSLWAVARAIKMTIKECQYQMRHEPWDCPIHGFSVKPAETFGMLMSRSYKETSFIQSLLSSAIVHSVARACTESIITTCSRKQLPHGNGFGEDIEFGRQFARDFMDVTHELKLQHQQQQQILQLQQQHQHQLQQQQQLQSSLESNQKASLSANSITMLPAHQVTSAEMNQHQLRVTNGKGYYSNKLQQHQQEPMWKEKRLRQMINVHNDEVGRLIVLNYMRRECKCHGISGACSMQTCWDRLPPFRDVANRLHDSLDKALRVEMYVAPHGSSLATSRHKSLTSAPAKKSNKKRSSAPQQPANPSSGLGRLAIQPAVPLYTPTTPMGDVQMDSANDSGAGSPGHDTGGSVNESGNSGGGGGGFDKQSSSEFAQNTIQYSSLLASQTNITSAVKKRPIARSIGLTASTITPGKLDLLYAEESPDFCVPSQRYNIKGTRGRICGENPNAANSCETLCCGRGYKTEIREEKYTCEFS